MDVITPWKEFVIRRYRHGEEDRMAALVTAGGASGGQSVVTVDLIRDEWADPRLELERDTWVATTDDGTYIAAAEVWLEAPDDPGDEINRHVGFTIHPDYRADHLDLMQYLFDRAVEHATDFPTPHEERAYYLRAWAAAHDRWKQQWILDHGFEPMLSSYTFVHDRLDTLDPVAAPDGIEIVPWRPELDRPLWRAINEEFEGDESYSPMTWEEWQRFYHGERMEPEHWRLALADGELIALALTEVDRYASPVSGWITALGVVAAHRSRGIGRALLTAALHALRDAGADEVQMAVDDLYEALTPRLYEAAGFRVRKGSHVYRRLIRPALR